MKTTVTQVMTALVNSNNELIAGRAKHYIETGEYIDSGSFFAAVKNGEFYNALHLADESNRSAIIHLF